jgi:glyceraldehyde 3-phosphate dehydrogenase (phosphorylating)
MYRVAINGLGRIGRATMRIVTGMPDFELVAVNDLAAPETLAYLLKYDSVYGRYDGTVATSDRGLVVGGREVAVLREPDPGRLPWRAMKVDLVFESTGAFTRRDDLAKHVEAGARFVILSAPEHGEGIETVVHGVNTPADGTSVISCASCTTNCITPVIEILERRFGVRKAAMTTIHAYTASQRIVDAPHTHLRRGRAGGVNMVPTSTGAATATTSVLPQLRGRFDGAAVRIPIPIGSLADIVALTARPTTVTEVNSVLTEEAETDRYRGIVGVTSDPLVSSDVIKDPRAAVVDLGLTQVIDRDLVKVVSWYDNEWGYSNQMVRAARRLLQQSHST